MDELARVCELIASHGSKLKKICILGEYLRELGDEDFSLAVQFLSTGPVAEGAANFHLFGAEEKSRLSVGGSVLRAALAEVVEWDRETLRVCYADVGDTGETIGLLLQEKTAGEALSLRGADAVYQELFRARTTARKRELLVVAFRRYRPLTLKYFVKVITRGLRIGLMGRMVEEAVALACEVPAGAVREANNRAGDLAQVAVAARRGELGAIATRLFHPMDFMLAKPLERLEDLAEPGDWVVEDKYDGIRSQVHFEAGHVEIYSRGMEEVTQAFPEIAAAFARLGGNGLIDGEILAWRDGRALNFNVLQQRIARKSVKASMLADVPAVFVAYDLLLRNDSLLLEEGFEERRVRLEATLEGSGMPLLLAPQARVGGLEDIERLFAEARARGNEGLLLKRAGSKYEAGKRSGLWQKLKRPYGTLDVVVTSAEQGSGRRAIYFSDYTFAVRSGEAFLNVGKAYSGLTDTEVKELTKVLRAASTDRFGPTMLVRPAVVLEVAFDGVQKSARHKSGYALRFPRILRWRKDKTPGECDELARVEEMYRASIE